MFITLLPSYVAPRYSYVTIVFVYKLCITVSRFVCSRMLPLCYSYVLMWCLSHDPSDSLFHKRSQIFRYILAFVFIC